MFESFRRDLHQRLTDSAKMSKQKRDSDVSSVQFTNKHRKNELKIPLTAMLLMWPNNQNNHIIIIFQYKILLDRRVWSYEEKYIL